MREFRIGEGQKYDTTQVSKDGVNKKDSVRHNKKLNLIFNRFDINQDGKLNPGELSNLVSVFNTADSNNDGKLSKDEFSNIAQELNEMLPFGKEISARDVKNFFKRIMKSQNKDEKIPEAQAGPINSVVTEDDAIKTLYAANNNTYEYTYNDNAIELTVKDPKGGIESKYECKLNEDGSSSFVQRNSHGDVTKELLKDSDGNARQQTKNTYNADGSRTETVIKDDKGNITKTTTFEYNSEGKMTLVAEKDGEGNITGTQEYTYDENGNETSVIQKDAHGNILGLVKMDKGVIYNQIRYEYDENGNKIQEKILDKNNNSIERTFDQNGNIKTCVEKDSDGNLKRTEEYSYDAMGNKTDGVKNLYYKAEKASSTKFIYDINGNVIKVVYKKPDGSVRSSEEYTYDENGNQTGKINKHSDGSVRSSVEYTYDENGNKTCEINKYPDGKIISAFVY